MFPGFPKLTLVVGLGFHKPKDTRLIKPSEAVFWCKEVIEYDHGSEVLKSKANLRDARHILAVIWSETPKHYTMVYVRGPGEGAAKARRVHGQYARRQRVQQAKGDAVPQKPRIHRAGQGGQNDT